MEKIKENENDQENRKSKKNKHYHDYTSAQGKLATAKKNLYAEGGGAKDIIESLYGTANPEEFKRVFEGLSKKYSAIWNDKEIQDVLTESGFQELYNSSIMSDSSLKADKTIAQDALASVKKTAENTLKSFEGIKTFYERKVDDLTRSLLSTHDVSGYVGDDGIIQREIKQIEAVERARKEDVASAKEHAEAKKEIEKQQEHEDKVLKAFEKGKKIQTRAINQKYAQQNEENKSTLSALEQEAIELQEALQASEDNAKSIKEAIQKTQGELNDVDDRIKKSQNKAQTLLQKVLCNR